MSGRSKKVKDDKAAIDKESAALDRDGKKEFIEQEDGDRYNTRPRFQDPDRDVQPAKK